ncbi:MAG: site-specific integrase [Acidimicrobiales bacterium]
MSGSLRQKSTNVWEVRFETGRDPLTGRRRQKSRIVHGRKSEAQKVLNALVVEADAGAHVGTSTTFEQLCQRWLDLTENDLSPTTLRTYRNLLDHRILPALGAKLAHNIRTVDLDRLYLGLTNEVGLAPATVRQIHAVIRRALRQGVRWGLISTNPAINASPPRLVKTDLSPPDVDQVGHLLQRASIDDPDLGRFLHVAASTGARRGEICALHWTNLDLSRQTLTIEHSIIEVPGGLKEKDTKTHANRRIALDERTIEVFEDLRRAAIERATRTGLTIDDNSYVFSHEPNGAIPWNPSNVTRRFQVLRHSLGYDNMRLHDLRHFTATRLMAAGVPVRTVSGRLGHANPSTTLSVYSHFVEASDQIAAGVMGGLLPPPLRGKKQSASPVAPTRRTK